MGNFQFRRNTVAGAAANNRVLPAGEPGIAGGTVLKVGDGTTPWNSLPEVGSGTYAPRLAGMVASAPLPSLVRKAMATAPTIGSVVTTSGISGGKFWGAVEPIGGAIMSDNWTVLRGGGAQRRGAGFPDYNFAVFRGITTTNLDSMGYTIAFQFDGTTLEFAYRQVAMTYQIVVDGEVAATGSQTTVSGVMAYLPITFATRKNRRIEIRVNSGAGFAGITTGPTDTLAPVGRMGPRCIVMGDSFTAATGATLGDVDGWVGVFRDAMGWPDTWASGAGGTGYLAPGSGGQVKFRDRVQADVIANNPDVVVIAGGINDYAGYTAAAIGAEAATLFAQIKTALPNVILIVLSPFWRNGVESYPGNLLPTRDALKTAALGAGGLWVDVLEFATQATPTISTTLAAAASSGATSVSSTARINIGSTIEIGTGTANVERRVVSAVSGSGPYALTVSVLANAHASGDVLKTVGGSLWTGTGKVGGTTGSGNSDYLVSSDGTHPSDAGHEAIGWAVARQVLAQARTSTSR